MQQVKDKEEKTDIHPIDTGQVSPEDDYEFSDDIEVIFRREYAKLATIPLRLDQPICWPLVWLVIVMYFSFVTGAVIGIVTSPTVTVMIVPRTKQVTLTTSLALPLRQLAPVTLTKTATRNTTGHGHQDATHATGTLTIYNSLFTEQVVYAGTVLSGQDGVQVATSTTVTVPANTPPFDGRATVSAYALQPGARGNIAAGDIHRLSQGLLMENHPFTGGRDARDFPTVAQTDVYTLKTALKASLMQQLPHAFPLRPNEHLYPTHCQFAAASDHGIGEEAATARVAATYTCSAVAYDQSQLQLKATAAFTATQPAKHYQLIGQVSSQVLTVSPFQVQMSGTRVYLLSGDDEQVLAQQIAGETPQQARTYLLGTGFFTNAIVPATLPKDPDHIHFATMIGA
jgi:hypothetical protein